MTKRVYKMLNAGERRACNLETDSLYRLPAFDALMLAWHECIEYHLPTLSEAERESVSEWWNYLIRTQY